MIWPLCFLDQTDPETYYRMDEFGLGPDLVVCPILEPKAESRMMYLPEGDWYDYWTREKVKGKQEFFGQGSP